MAKIKCRYHEFYCGHPDASCFGLEAGHECFDQSECICDYMRTADDRFPPSCLFIRRSEREFEKEVKAYDLELSEPDPWLETFGHIAFRGRYIEQDSIDYLEIDGRVLVTEEQNDSRGNQTV